MATKRGMGRPAKLVETPDIHRLIVAALSRGHYPTTAADLVGITRESLRNWLDAGAIDAEHGKDTPYARLHRDCSAATAQWIDRQIGRVQDAGEKDWRASASILGRRHREWSEKPSESESGRNITIQIGIALPGTTSHSLPAPSSSAYLDVIPELLSKSVKD